MKYIAMILAVLAASGCTSETKYGECIGVQDEKDPSLVYHVSVYNVALGIIFSETIVVPVVVILSELSCPVGQQVKK